jgi:hypothetical protein
MGQRDRDVSGWKAMETELDHWTAAGQTATLWWRDDDAAEAVPALDRLLDLAGARSVPLCLAVIPERATSEAVKRAAARPEIDIAVHGLAHVNHAPSTARKAEFGGNRPLATMLAELARARARLAELAGDALRPILVPPWNRIAPRLVPRLPEVGFTGLSTYLARKSPMPAPGLRQVNAHIDIIDWRGSRGFIGEAAALKLAVDHLADRRQGRVDGNEPTGLLSHHLAHDPSAWDFIANFVDVTRAHGATRWLGLDAAFGETA